MFPLSMRDLLLEKPLSRRQTSRPHRRRLMCILLRPAARDGLVILRLQP